MEIRNVDGSLAQPGPGPSLPPELAFQQARSLLVAACEGAAKALRDPSGTLQTVNMAMANLLQVHQRWNNALMAVPLNSFGSVFELSTSDVEIAHDLKQSADGNYWGDKFYDTMAQSNAPIDRSEVRAWFTAAIEAGGRAPSE